MCPHVLCIDFITRAIRKANVPPQKKATVLDKDVQSEQARALAEFMCSSAKTKTMSRFCFASAFSFFVERLACARTPGRRAHAPGKSACIYYRKKEDEKVRVDAIEEITLAALPNDCR